MTTIEIIEFVERGGIASMQLEIHIWRILAGAAVVFLLVKFMRNRRTRLAA